MQGQRICCVCCQPISGNYYKIDGVRFWCIPCGEQWLKDADPNYRVYRSRVAMALSEVNTDKIIVKEKVRRGQK